MFLGATDFNKIHQPGNFRAIDASLQREQAWPTLSCARWACRGSTSAMWRSMSTATAAATLMEDTQVPDSDVVKEHFPNDSDGFLYKMQPWFELAPFPSGYDIAFNKQSWCNLDALHHHRRREKSAALSL